MNIQIFGSTKCFDTKKAERYFKERKIKYQSIDIIRYGLSQGEFKSIRQSIKNINDLINENSKEYEEEFIKYLSSEEAISEKLLENTKLLRTPIVRNGKKSTVGYIPEVWKEWE